MTDYEKLLEEAEKAYAGPECPTCGGPIHGPHRPVLCRDNEYRRCSVGDVLALAAALREVMAERDEAQAKVQWFVERAADEKLDGYRELGARAAKAENDRDTALATIGKIRCVVGKAGTDDDVLDAVRSALADAEAMRAALSDAATALEQASNDLTIDSRNDMRHQRGAVATVELSIEGLATAALDAMVAAERAKSALGARDKPPPRWRPEVAAFADAMERELRENEHKGGWRECDKDWLMDRLTQEAKELREAIDLGGGRASKFFPNDPNAPTWQATVLSEAADVANFAMMIADVCDALDARATPPSSHRCPGCNAAHRGEYDHCETCRAKIAAPNGKETTR